MPTPSSSALSLVLILIAILNGATAKTFHQGGKIFYGGQERANILDGGKRLTLSLDKYSGSGYQSTDCYLFGRFDMNIKLVPNNSAGTVSTYYLSSGGSTWDEIDFEFLGNKSGQPYTIHTNIFSQGQGNREQRFRVWFDPTTSYHKYTVIWNPQRIIMMVDNIAIRVFNNNEAIGVPFPNSQAMNVYTTIWCGDSWATEGGRIKTNWTEAPFTASYKSFVIKSCESCANSSSNSTNSSSTSNSTNSSSTSTTPAPAWLTQSLSSLDQRRSLRVRQNYMIYNYCTDYERFSQGLPPECGQPEFMQ